MSYIWSREVKKIWKGGLVEFTDWSSSVYTARQLEYVVTDEAKDATEYRDLCVRHIVYDVFEVFDKNNIRNWDVDQVLQRVIHWYERMMNKACWISLWRGGELADHEYQERVHNVSMSDIRKTLKTEASE